MSTGRMEVEVIDECACHQLDLVKEGEVFVQTPQKKP